MKEHMDSQYPQLCTSHWQIDFGAVIFVQLSWHIDGLHLMNDLCASRTRPIQNVPPLSMTISRDHRCTCKCVNHGCSECYMPPISLNVLRMSATCISPDHVEPRRCFGIRFGFGL